VKPLHGNWTLAGEKVTESWGEKGNAEYKSRKEKGLKEKEGLLLGKTVRRGWRFA